MIFSYLEMALWGVAAGLMASIPLGPIGVLCIQRTLGGGRLAGFVSGMGAATADTFFAVLALFSLGYINSFIEKYNFWVEIVGGLIVVIFGLTIFYKRVARPSRAGDKRSGLGLVSNYLSVLFLTLPNPAYFFVFVWIFAAIGIGSSTWVHNLVVLMGVLVGAATWWFTLTYFVSKLRKKFSYRGLWWMNKISGGLIVLLGAWAVIKVVASLMPFLEL